MKMRELLESKRQDVFSLAAKYGAFNIRLFGSVARGEDDENSDIDILVDLEVGRSLFDLGGLHYELEELLGCSVDVVTEMTLKERIRQRVKNEAVLL